jgi:hypothetical protein
MISVPFYLFINTGYFWIYLAGKAEDIYRNIQKIIIGTYKVG